jgi:hypothetical protein
MSPKPKAQRKTHRVRGKIFDVRFLDIKQPPGKMDPLVRDSIEHTGLWCLEQVKPDLPDKGGKKSPAAIRKFLYSKLLKHAPQISVITKKLNTDSALINAKTRSLLANRDVYMYLLYDTIKTAALSQVVFVQEKSSDQKGKGSGKAKGKAKRVAAKGKAPKAGPKKRGKAAAKAKAKP